MRNATKEKSVRVNLWLPHFVRLFACSVHSAPVQFSYFLKCCKRHFFFFYFPFRFSLLVQMLWQINYEMLKRRKKQGKKLLSFHKFAYIHFKWSISVIEMNYIHAAHLNSREREKWVGNFLLELFHAISMANTKKKQRGSLFFWSHLPIELKRQMSNNNKKRKRKDVNNFAVHIKFSTAQNVKKFFIWLFLLTTTKPTTKNDDRWK